MLTIKSYQFLESFINYETIGLLKLRSVSAFGLKQIRLLLELAGDHGTELVLLQSSLATRLSDEYLDDLAHRLSCLVLEVPSVGEPAPDSATLLQSIQSAIGSVI